MKNSLLSFIAVLGLAGNAFAQCSAPTSLTTSYASNVTTFDWAPVSGATDYVIEIKQSWDSWSYPEVIDTISTDIYTLTGIMHSISLDWRVKAICASGVSAYQTVTNYTLPCPQPSSLTTSSVTMTGATVNWTAPAGYNTYVSDFAPAYRKAGTTTWTSLGSTFGTSKTITGLLANTAYEWRVYMTCPYSNSSTTTSTFTTLACNSAGTNSAEWISRFKLGTIDRTSSAESGGYVNTNLSTNMTIGSSSNQCKIRVDHTGGFTNKTFKVYIDFNSNNIYEETEIVLGPSTITSSGLTTFYMSIPSTVTAGTRGMRVIMARSGTTITGCMTGFNGETEDYKVNLTTSGHKADPGVTEAEESTEKINVFPNPGSNSMNIQLTEDVSNVNVYDIMGKKIYEEQASTNGTMHIDIAKWPTGQYIVEAIYADGHKDVVRFAKQ